MSPSTASSLGKTELTDGRLRLRPWRIADGPALAEAARESLMTVGRWLPWCHKDYGLADAVAWIEHCEASQHRAEHFAFAVFDTATAELLGGAGLSQRNLTHHHANLGYWVRQSRQHQGIAIAAATLVARFGFAELRLARIEIVALLENTASRATAERLGARFEAVARNRLWTSGQALDAAVYGLTEGDLT
ncbi:MAG: GNAT family N-acetyltransferase [Rhodanobacter sp.]